MFTFGCSPVLDLDNARLFAQQFQLEEDSWQDKHFDAYRDEIAAIRAGAIDGYVIDELNQFLPHLSSSDWRKCREVLEGLR